MLIFNIQNIDIQNFLSFKFLFNAVKFPTKHIKLKMNNYVMHILLN